mmetsp:Transcript_47033/g.98625  ORF Transcript_47033/g.98625 Transcript_47033/m.98625 type:complete len:131 (+) Transcript_47033:106-498(+)
MTDDGLLFNGNQARQSGQILDLQQDCDVPYCTNLRSRCSQYLMYVLPSTCLIRNMITSWELKALSSSKNNGLNMTPIFDCQLQSESEIILFSLLSDERWAGLLRGTFAIPRDPNFGTLVGIRGGISTAAY